MKDEHAMWVLYFTHRPKTLSECMMVWTERAKELRSYCTEVREKQETRQGRKVSPVRTVREWLEHKWVRENSRRVLFPKKNGAGKLTCHVEAARSGGVLTASPLAFATGLLSKRSGHYRGSKSTYPIMDKEIVIVMPRNWNFVVPEDDKEPNVALPNGKTEGPAMRLYRSRGYSMVWYKGYYFKGQFIDCKEWSEKQEKKTITTLVREKLARATA